MFIMTEPISIKRHNTNLSILNKDYNLNLSTEVSERVDWDYNCMGFAIGTYEWEDLHSFDYTYECDYEDEDEVFELRNSVCWSCADELVSLHKYNERYPKMRIVHNEHDLLDNEYLITMRLAEEDFHFMRRMDDGRWFEKCGPNILRECTDNVYDDVWYSIHHTNEYNSEIIFLAVEKEVA